MQKRKPMNTALLDIKMRPLLWAPLSGRMKEVLMCRLDVAMSDAASIRYELQDRLYAAT